MGKTVELDCQQCGACCVNLPANEALSFVYWVEIASGDAILARPELQDLITRDEEGVPHLRIVGRGRCAALRGSFGRKVRCSIYAHRPSPCRIVKPGDADCLRSRRAHGLM